MKSFGSTSLQDEQRPQSRNSQHHLHTTTTSPFPSKPSSSNNATGLTMNSGVSNTGKRHGFSLGRFSLRRFLNPSTFTRTVVGSSNSKQPKGSQAHQAHSKDLHTDNSSTGENKVPFNMNAIYIYISSYNNTIISLSFSFSLSLFIIRFFPTLKGQLSVLITLLLISNPILFQVGQVNFFKRNQAHLATISLR